MKSRLFLTMLTIAGFVVLSMHAPPPADWPAANNLAQSPRLPYLDSDWSPGPSPDSSPLATVYHQPAVVTRKRTRRRHWRLPDYDNGHYAQGVPHVRVDRLPEINAKRYLEDIPMAERSYEPDPALKDRVNRWLNWLEASSAWDGHLPDVGNGQYVRGGYSIDYREYDDHVVATPRNGRAWPVTPGRIRPYKQDERLPSLH